ncbi:TIGR04141 family sporadically distributed protein [Ahrensia sp. R2A130]|uniref:TIGR04141 family sporadically distributed protein n=1 Tax=Ahrensia sp. R2A130 TaxID=744979 RepID=UPI0001E0D805|nr:TIGR04141 family sporadically distributed protein [Ahrensia sp. R2A130]EFL90325.1 conserved hypothetical protein [Ahrensia sp. R2A130]
MPKSEKFSLHLFKPGTAAVEVLSENFREKLTSGEVSRMTRLAGSAVEMEGFFTNSFPKEPMWFSTLRTTFEIPEKKGSSPASIVTFVAKERRFALTFGYGASLLNDQTKVHDFGILVAMNLLSASGLKTIQRSSLIDAKNSAMQSVSASTYESFGGLRSFELLKRVAGPVSNDPTMLQAVGSSSLSFASKKPLSEVPDVAERALDLYAAIDYQSTAFADYDHLKPVVDPIQIRELKQQTADLLCTADSGFELGFPAFLSGEASYTKLQGRGMKGEKPDISVAVYREALGPAAAVIHPEHLDQDYVLVFSDDHRMLGRKSIYRCLVGGLQDKHGVQHVISEGQWYVPSDAIRVAAQDYFDRHVREEDKSLPSWNARTVIKTSKKGKKTHALSYEAEEVYNTRAAASSGYLLLDQKWFGGADRAFSKLEACDLFDPEGLRFIHVKRTGRSPSSTAYLFEQGRRSAELLADDRVRGDFADILEKEGHPKTAAKIRAMAREDFIVEFVIADMPNDDGRMTVPFLAKLAFAESTKFIESLGFKSQLRFIPLPRP